jgi:hypothetical protein
MESNPKVAKIRLKALWKQASNWKDILVDTGVLMDPKSKVDGLCGPSSRRLSNKLVAASTDLERFKLFCEFFLVTNIIYSFSLMFYSET